LALFSLGSFWLTIADFVERYEAVTYRYVLGNLRLLRNHAFVRRPLLRIRVSTACLSATSFMERYVVKPEALPEGKRRGRIWGTWNEEMLPVRWETVKVTPKDGYRIRRI
jgi:hypothetical protein